MVIFDQSRYRKSYKPKPVGDSQKVALQVELAVKRIDRIEELKSSYQIRLIMVIAWMDPRLSFVNLRDDMASNIVNDETASAMWIPPLLIPEALTDYSLEYEKKSYLVVRKEQMTGQNTGFENVHEGILFDGSKNKLALVKQLQLKHSCTFELMHYPFDTQLCKFKVTPFITIHIRFDWTI